ncbi:Lcl C-terminal domain-containing protein [Desulfolutivibrio sp.]|uniref:Lcl C-terminal domain-containing protein n=1 Tax=Desulfolutivibrio sp. TaxID=2773296 RepID=UPI002F96E8E5
MNASSLPAVPPGQMSPPLPTGMAGCHDLAGQAVPCPGSGQDGDGREPGKESPHRFMVLSDKTVRDELTGLRWHPAADALGYPVSFSEALSAVADFNAAAAHGRRDWRMPNRRELRSILCHGAKNPALWPGHPFRNVFFGRYWTSTSFAGSPAHAWYVHLEGARVFYERKDRYCLLWPVCGDSHGLAATGQDSCFNMAGEVVPCAGSGQDGEMRRGLAWPNPRFAPGAGTDVVFDRLTGLSWLARPVGALAAEGAPAPCDWGQALAAVAAFAARDGRPWRLPDINELESLTDLSRAFPALPGGHPFRNLGDGFWSATTSFYDPAWAYVLYLGKGAVGVGFKVNREFSAWPVLRPGA